MNSLQEKALRLTDKIDIPFEDLESGGNGITEAAEDKDFYYIVTGDPIPKDDPYGNCFWVVDKITKRAIRAGIYIGWVTAMADLKEKNAVRILKEPYVFK